MNIVAKDSKTENQGFEEQILPAEPVLSLALLTMTVQLIL
jgi:hypothetical protein